MDVLNNTLADAVADELELLLSPEDEIEDAAEGYRRVIASCERRAADRRKACAAFVAEIEDEQRRIEAVYHKDIARLDAEIVAAKASAAKDIATAKKLEHANRTALEALQS